LVLSDEYARGIEPRLLKIHPLPFFLGSMAFKTSVKQFDYLRFIVVAKLSQDQTHLTHSPLIRNTP
jgi:hypothetical protein